MTKWEYCWLNVVGEQHEVLKASPDYPGEYWLPPGARRLRSDEAMEELGRLGWELAGIAPSMHTASWGTAYRMYFKRPLE